MSRRNAHRIRRLEGSDPDGNTFTSHPFSLLVVVVVVVVDDSDERSHASATAEGNLTPVLASP